MSKNSNILNWESYNDLSLVEKGNLISHLPHTLISQQFKRTQINELCRLASKIRFICKTKEGAYYLKSILCDNLGSPESLSKITFIFFNESTLVFSWL